MAQMRRTRAEPEGDKRPFKGKGEQCSGYPKQASQRGESPGGREGALVLNPCRGNPVRDWFQGGQNE